MKKQGSLLLLILIFALSCFPAGIISANASTGLTEPTIIVESKTSAPGEQIKVNVNIENNPGIAGATLSISYDSKLKLKSAESGSVFSKLNFTAPGKFDNPSKFLWDSESGQVNDDGTILILTFDVPNDVESNAKLSVDVSYYQGDIYNEQLDNVKLKTVSGNVSVAKSLIGDVDQNGEISILDATLIQKYLADFESLSSEQILIADTDQNNDINIKDSTEIQKYLTGIISLLGNGTDNQKTYSVIFKDYDGTVVKTENVKSGNSAIAPDAPQREGYIFSKWDKSFDKVTNDIVITAEYIKIDKPTLFLQSASAVAGDTVQVPIKIYNNPGINGMQLNVSYDEKLTLQNAENGTALSSLYFTKPGVYANPSKFLWDGVGEDETGNGTVLILTFKIPTDAKSGNEYKISVVSPEGSIFDSYLNDVDFDIVIGSIIIK